MATDVVVSRELKSLQDELANAKKEKDRNASADRSASTTAAAEAVVPTTASPLPQEEADTQDYLRQLADEVIELFEKAEKSVSAHPTESVAGALVLGILIGRLLGRR